MDQYFVDLHVHIGRSSRGNIVKRATANNLTLENIAHECLYRKGINIIGIVDAISPYVIYDIEMLLERGIVKPIAEGGLLYHDQLTILLGAEIETREVSGCHSHSLAFFPDFQQIKEFAKDMGKYIKNIYACCSMAHLTGQQLYDIVSLHGGLYIPAHAFTPNKSFYGNCTHTLKEIFSFNALNDMPSIELGLSADTYMADMLKELAGMTFLSNSDAHSLPKIGREYNTLRLKAGNYQEVLMALNQQQGRAITGNYGLDPKLGKYHRTFCINCNKILKGEPPINRCPVSDKHKVVVGVLDRLEQIRDPGYSSTIQRPPYHYQIPLEFIPGIGPKTIDRLLEVFNTEMNVLHRATLPQLREVVGEKTANLIVSAREGNLNMKTGGGGSYGKILV